MSRQSPTQADAEAAILTLALDRGAGRSLCPSEAARALAEDWRPLMPLVRQAAAALAARGAIVVTQRGAPVDALHARGPIRLGLP
jgi:hypothetical protein